MQQSCIKVFTGYAVLLLRNIFRGNVLGSLALSKCKQNFHVEVHNICAAAVFEQARLYFHSHNVQIYIVAIVPVVSQGGMCTALCQWRKGAGLHVLQFQRNKVLGCWKIVGKLNNTRCIS